MPQALKPPCVIHFWSWVISLFSELALWANKNWPPSMKVQQMENFKNIMGLKGYKKWSSLNAPGTEIPLSHSVLELDFSLFSLLALWGNKNWPPSIKVKQIENCQNKTGLKGCKWSTLKALGTQTPLSHSVLELDFSLFSLLALPGNENWPPSIKVEELCYKIGLACLE